jgi:3-methyladenine DNA glycosylase AlkD
MTKPCRAVSVFSKKKLFPMALRFQRLIKSASNTNPADFQFFENWIKKYVNNWASCDTFCNHTVGTFIEMYPEYITKLKDFANSDNR